jgi:hypothetical protein
LRNCPISKVTEPFDNPSSNLRVSVFPYQHLLSVFLTFSHLSGCEVELPCDFYLQVPNDYL